MSQTMLRFISFLLLLFASSCSVIKNGGAENYPSLPVSATILPNLTITPASLLVTVGETISTETSPITILSTMTVTPSPSLTSTSTPITLSNTDPTCQEMTLLPNDTFSLLSSGSILIQISREDSILAFSKGMAKPFLLDIQAKDMIGLPYLSPSRTQIAVQDTARNIILYNLLRAETMLIPWQETWQAVGLGGWSADERIELFVKSEYLLGTGIIRETFLVDPATLYGEPSLQEFSLPDFYFDDKNPFHGFASWNPSETMVVYTAGHPSHEGMRYILRDVTTNEDLWHSTEIDGEVNPVANWSENGDKILLAVTPPRTINEPNPGPIELVSLEIDDLRYEVLSQLTSLPDMANIRYLEWSPDMRYIFFTLWETAFQGPGYILDTIDDSVHQICETGFVNGQWLPETNQLLYAVAINDEKYELKLLDVPSWQAQSLQQEEVYPHYIGWTPVIFFRFGHFQ